MGHVKDVVSLYVIDPFMKCFELYTAKNPRHRICFISNNGHAYFIEEEKMKTFISQAKRIDLDTVSWEYETSKFYVMKNYNASEQNDLDYGVTYQGSDYDEAVKGSIKDADVLLFDGSIEKLALDVIKSTGYMITALKIRESIIEAFQHPVTGQIIEYSPDYDKRKHVRDKFYSIKQLECFKFRNQSFTQLAGSMFEVMFGRVHKSSHIKEDEELIDMYHTKALMETLVKGHKFNENCKGFDIKKSYPTAVMNMSGDYPIFSITDSFVPYRNEDIVIGEYLIEEVVIEQLGGLRIPKCIMSYIGVKYLIDNGYMDKESIICMKKASYVLDRNNFAEYIKFLKETFDEATFKVMACHWIGQFGKRFQSSDEGFITNDFDTACASYFDNTRNHWSMSTLEDLHFVRVSNKTRIFGDYAQINRQILTQGMIQLMDLLKQVLGPKSVLVGYNTDAVFVENPNKIEINKESPYKVEDWKPKFFRDAVEEENEEIEVTDLEDWKKLDDIQFNGDKVLIGGIEVNDSKYLNELKGKSFCAIGGGGCQKSALLVKLNDENSIVLCYTNKACDRIRKEGIKSVFTFDSYFQTNDKIPEDVTKVQVDEFGMIPSKWVVQLYKLKQRGVVIQMFGDLNQCKQICELQRYFNYPNKKVIRELCDYNLMEKEIR